MLGLRRQIGNGTSTSIIFGMIHGSLASETLMPPRLLLTKLMAGFNTELARNIGSVFGRWKSKTNTSCSFGEFLTIFFLPTQLIARGMNIANKCVLYRQEEETKVIFCFATEIFTKIYGKKFKHSKDHTLTCLCLSCHGPNLKWFCEDKLWCSSWEKIWVVLL